LCPEFPLIALFRIARPLLNYVDWETVLVTPKSFLRRFEAAAAPFSCQVAHEELAKFVPAFHAAGTQIARERFKTR
jgi:hypothetical protein